MNGNEQMSGLWIAQSTFKDDPAKINDGKFLMAQSGEIILRGYMEEGTFRLEEVSRLAFAGFVIDNPDNPFGKVTIVGPVPEESSFRKPVSKQEGRSGVVTELQLQVHYRQLTLDAIKRGDFFQDEETDAYIPPVVYMNGVMVWEQISDYDKTVWLSIKLYLTDATDLNTERKLENLAHAITFNDALQVEFYSVDDALPDDSPDTVVEDGKVYRLCSRPARPCDAGAIEMLIRRLPIRFICLFAASPAEQAELPGLCDTQIDGTCEVWREQAILAAQVENAGAAVVEFAGPLLAAETFTDSQVEWEALISAPTANDPRTIDVFLVREVKRQNGSQLAGVSYNITTISAGVVLPLWALRDAQHKRLLAHELGHCLGLADRGARRFIGTTELPQGSRLSVMQIMHGHAPRENTAGNCAIFDEQYLGLLNPLAKVVLPLRKDCLRPLLP